MILKIHRIIFMLILFSGLITAGDWQVDKDAKNSVVFMSSTTLLDFEGKTSDIDGYLFWKGEEIFADGNELYFEILLNTFSTGIGKRDRDMRDDILETKKYPYSSFKAKITKSEKKDEAYHVLVKGEMILHGQKKEMEIPGVITIKDGLMNIKTSFTIFLDDFKIAAPSLIAFIKVANEIKLELDFNLREIKLNL
ncbi:MAG: YceI family protein [Calditrichaeota bacterium]|nr:MAG: YceI family protein [Calditrichota bacterium]MBL1207782.1 YceI family protein [Calditrichota bacterium]NOG47615.1 YceI family protein [Calditrichota bacterium]